MSERDPNEDNTPWTHQPYGGSAEQPQAPQPPAYPTNPYADPSAQPGHQGQPDPAGQAGQPQWGQQPYQSPQSGYGHQPYPQGYAQPYPQVPNHPSAYTALVLGIVALGGAFVCFLPVLVGPFAWFTGAKVRREIDADPQRYGGRSEATAGMILGIVATALLALAVLAVVAVIVIGVATASTVGY